MSLVIEFGAAGSEDAALVGGKGASLGRLTAAELAVPPGFSVTTDAYREHLTANGLSGVIEDFLTGLDYTDPADLEARTAKLRAQIIDAPMPPAMRAAVVDAYGSLGVDTSVAVRSSGTAEDLAEASFAGLHDSFLDVRGADDLVDAIRRCWASMWTARATAYRGDKGFDQRAVAIAVVVQRMVPSEVSGVLFTGNPSNAATDEMVINASWGLGEAIVSGQATPDEFVLRARDLHIVQRRLGDKAIRIDNDPDARSGTTTTEVPLVDQQRYCLTDAQVAELGALGRRVTDHCDGFPQDIEFAFAGGELYLLQSRPITGVLFSWDADLEDESWQPYAEEEGTLWSRALTDEMWTGACTPLYYSIRGRLWCYTDWTAAEMWGLPGHAGHKDWKYYKGVPYANAAWWDTLVQVYPPSLRAMFVRNLDPRRAADLIAAPHHRMTMAKVMSRAFVLDRNFNDPSRIFKSLDEFLYGEFTTKAAGRTDEEISRLSDRELIRYADDLVELEARYPIKAWSICWLYYPMALHLLGHMIQHWYRGNDATVMMTLVSGTPRRTATVIETTELWELSRGLRRSPDARAAFERSDAISFESALAESAAGQAWLVAYREFRDRYGHRGHADRDIYHARRSEDPALDYNALAALLPIDDDHAPDIAESRTNARREAAYLDVTDSLRRGPLGSIKVEAFKVVFEWIGKFNIFRDDERSFADISTMSLKRAYQEIGRRLTRRGLAESDRDFYFLGRDELYDVLLGRANMKLARAKIAARMKNFDAVDAKEVVRPEHLLGNNPAHFGEDEDTGTGTWRGTPTSGGSVTGTARVVRRLSEIGSIKSGEILVTNSTDPGWTPVFLIIKGVVVETGGLLSHASCLAREYGFPAVQLPGAISKIPDGAIITIDGDTGVVTLADSGGS